MDRFHQIERGTQVRPRCVLFVGKRGIDLPAPAARSPGTVTVLTDDSIPHFGCDRFPAPDRFSRAPETLGEPPVESRGCCASALNPLDALERLVFEDVRHEQSPERTGAAPFAVGTKMALSPWRERPSRLDALRGTCLLDGPAKFERVAVPPPAPVPLAFGRCVPALEARASGQGRWWRDEAVSGSYVREACSARRAGSPVINMTPTRLHVIKSRLGLSWVPMNALEQAFRAVPSQRILRVLGPGGATR